MSSEPSCTARPSAAFPRGRLRKELCGRSWTQGCAPRRGRTGVLFAVCQDRAVKRTAWQTRAGQLPSPDGHQLRVRGGQSGIEDGPNWKSAFHDVPAVITLFAPKGSLSSAEDCAAAAESMMPAADFLGIGSCCTGQNRRAFAAPCKQEILRKRSIRAGHYAVTQLLPGY